MIAIINPRGNFIKEGQRYMLRAEEGETTGVNRRQWATDNGYEFSPPTEFDLNKLQSFEVLKKNRDLRLTQGFEFRGKLIQTRSQVDTDNIRSVALRATNDPDFVTGFITADNSVLELDAEGCIEMHTTMVSAGNAVFASYIAKRAALVGVTTSEELSEFDFSL